MSDNMYMFTIPPGVPTSIGTAIHAIVAGIDDHPYILNLLGGEPKTLLAIAVMDRGIKFVMDCVEAMHDDNNWGWEAPIGIWWRQMLDDKYHVNN